MNHKTKDILERIEGSSPNESSHELICRLRDCAHEIEALRSALASRPDAQADERGALMCERLRAMGLNTATEAADLIEQMARAAAPKAEVAQGVTEGVYRALADILSYAERQICMHENTHRGGAIWDICDDCGAEWADDNGGKPEFKWPKEIIAARSVFNSLAVPSPDREQVGEAGKQPSDRVALIQTLMLDWVNSKPGDEAKAVWTRIEERLVEMLGDASPSRECGERPVDPDDIDAVAEAIQRETSALWEDASRAAVAAIDTLIARGNHGRERGEPQDCPHGVDDGACGWCYDEKASLAANQCVHAKGIVGDEGGTPCCPVTMTPDASAPTLGGQSGCGVCERGECAAVDCGYPCVADQQRANWAFLLRRWDESPAPSPVRAGIGTLAIEALRNLLATPAIVQHELTDEQRESIRYASEWLARSEDIGNRKHAERLSALLAAKGE